jgi:hypothetical protein
VTNGRAARAAGRGLLGHAPTQKERNEFGGLCTARSRLYRRKRRFQLPSSMLRSGMRALAQLQPRGGARGYQLVPMVIEASGCDS